MKERQALQETEERLSSIVNTIDDVVWSIAISSEMKIIYISPAVKKVFRRDVEEFKKNNLLWIECIHPDDRATVADYFSQLEHKGYSETERRIIWPDGSIRWIRDRGWNIYDANGNVLRVDGIISDITNRKKAEDALRESEVLFRAIVENSHNAICIINEAQKITWINERMVELSGFTREQILAAPSFKTFLAPESVEFVTSNFDAFIRGRPHLPNYQFHFIRADGKKRTVEKHMTGYTDKMGKHNLIISMLDITDLLHAEESLWESESRWRSYVEYAPYGVFITNADGHCLQVNSQACKITGYNESEMLEMSVIDLLLPEERNTWKDSFSHLVKTGEYHGEMRYLHKSGEKRWWTLAAVKIGESSYVSFANDTTTRKNAEVERMKLEAQLHHSQKMDSIGELAAGIAHEINNPVGFVLGNSETIVEYMSALKKLISLYERGASQEEIENARNDLDIEYILGDVNSLLQDNLNGLHRVKEIVANLKDFARIDPGLGFVEANLEESIMKTLTIAKNEIKYQIEVSTIFENKSSVFCNIGEMNQVLLNIIVNAAQAIKGQNRKEKGHITIKTSENDHDVICQICDDGPGIPKEIQSRIFEPFFTTKEVGKGTGLGLSIAYDIIVNKHKGQLQVQSEPDQGATFNITIPKNHLEN
jgi:PAS domain S-box-containing protein